MTTCLTILGCGGSLGVPLWGNIWGNCDPANPKNNRKRTSAMVDHQGKRFLIDTSPDLRASALEHNIREINGVLYTHPHADHIAGIDELRGAYWLSKNNIDLYGSQETLGEITERFPYLFNGGEGDLYQSYMNIHVLEPGKHQIQGTEITALEVDHTLCRPFSYRFGNLAYTTDVKYIPPESFSLLEGITHWVISCPFLSDDDHPTHAGLPQVLRWAEKLQPGQVYLTHLGHAIDYEKLLSMCPENVQPCYDGMVIEAEA